MPIKIQKGSVCMRYMWIGMFLIVMFCHFCAANALYCISKRRQLKASWLAWIPVLQLWTLGNIADHYQRTVQDKKSYLRFCVPVLTVCGGVLFCYSFVIMMALVLAAALGGLSNMFIGSPDVGEVSSALQQDIMETEICMAVACVLIILQRLAKVLSLYRIYRSCKPEKALARALCSVLPCVPVVQLHLLRNCDEGMLAPDVTDESIPCTESENSEEESSAEQYSD